MEREGKSDKPVRKQMNDAEEGRTVFVRNVNYNIDEETIKDSDLFTSFGKIIDVKLVKKRDQAGHKGVAFVKFDSSEAADKAVSLSDSYWNETKENLGKGAAQEIGRQLELGGRKVVIK